MHFSDLGFKEVDFIWLLLGWNVPCSSCNFPVMIPRVYVSSQNGFSTQVTGMISSRDVETAHGSFWMSHTLELCHRYSGASPLTWVSSIRHASSASANNTACAAVLFWRLCQSLSWDRHCCSAGPTHCLPHQLLHLSILLIDRPCKIAKTLFDRIQHHLNWICWLSGCQSRFFSIYHIILLLVDCCHSILNLHSCHSRFSINRILNELLCPLGV